MKYLAATILALTIIQPLAAREDMRRTIDKGDMRRTRESAKKPDSYFVILRFLIFGK